MSNGPLAASFRDPSGFLFHHEGTLFRQVNRSYESDNKLLIPHREVSLDLAPVDGAVRVLEPELVPFISYPYEWCFKQLKDASACWPHGKMYFPTIPGRGSSRHSVNLLRLWPPSPS